MRDRPDAGTFRPGGDAGQSKYLCDPASLQQGPFGASRMDFLISWAHYPLCALCALRVRTRHDRPKLVKIRLTSRRSALVRRHAAGTRHYFSSMRRRDFPDTTSANERRGLRQADACRFLCSSEPTLSAGIVVRHSRGGIWTRHFRGQVDFDTFDTSPCES
jgi:hypothetical protein